MDLRYIEQYFNNDAMLNNLIWTTIAYRNVQEGNEVVRIYNDETESVFFTQVDAMDYAAYLLERGHHNVETYSSSLINEGELDLNALRRSDALNKLTLLERELLGL